LRFESLKEKTAMKFRAACVAAVLLSLAAFTFAQTSAATASALPRLVRFGGTVKDLNGAPLTGVVGITFALYSEQTGGAALWIETQNVTADSNGHYVALLGSTKPDGLPADLFTSEQAHWVGVQVSGQAEQPRVLLVSAPYALKAGDAETIGGLPPSAFVLAAPPVSGGDGSSGAAASAATSSGAAITNTSSDVTTTGGTVNDIPLFSTSTNIQNSILSQSGTASVSVAGAFKFPATGTATATAGKDSQPQEFVASSYNKSTSTAENQTFQWQAEPASNDTTSPSGTLNLLYGLGATAPAETGLKLSSTGLFTFATAQTFPGTGTITGVTTASGSGLGGGGTTGTLSLSVPSAGITNTMLKNSSVTLNASTAGGLTVPGAMTLGDTYTIGLKTCSANQVLEYVGTAWTCTTPTTGTVTSVATGAGLTGGPITGSGTLSIPSAGVTNAMLANSKITLNSGTGITAPGAMTLGDTYTVSINTAVVPELTSNNSFTGSNSFSSTTGNGLAAATSAAGESGLFASNSSTSGGYGVFGINYNVTDGAVAGVNYSTGAGYAIGVYGQSNGSAGTGVYGAGAGNGIYGTSEAGSGVYGISAGTGAGVYGINSNTNASGPTYGVYGISSDTFFPNSAGVYGQNGGHGIGVFGEYGSESVMGANYGEFSGVWGDSDSYGYEGVLGTTDNGNAGSFYNNSASFPTVAAFNQGTDGTGLVLEARGSAGTGCTIDVRGTLNCDGTVNAVVPTDGGARKVSLYAVQSPENWFEDFGSGSLSNGTATIALDPTFTQTVNTGAEYHVFLTPNGDSKGLYVSQKTATSFEVREQGGGTSSIAFDYRIVAKRSGYENVRLADVTDQYKRLEQQEQQRRERARQHRARLASAPRPDPLATRPAPPAPPKPIPLPAVALKTAATQGAQPRN
jgi:hypothetical protein